MHKLFLFDNSFLQPKLRIDDNIFLNEVYTKLKKEKYIQVHDFHLIQIIAEAHHFSNSEMQKTLRIEIQVDEINLLSLVSFDTHSVNNLKEGNVLFSKKFGNIFLFNEHENSLFVLVFNECFCEIYRESLLNDKYNFQVTFITNNFTTIRGGHVTYLMKYFETGKFDNSYYPYDNDKDLFLL